MIELKGAATCDKKGSNIGQGDKNVALSISWQRFQWLRPTSS